MTKEQKWRNLRPDKKNKILKKCCRPVRKIRSLARGLYAVVTAVDQREKAQILDYSPHSLKHKVSFWGKNPTTAAIGERERQSEAVSLTTTAETDFAVGRRSRRRKFSESLCKQFGPRRGQEQQTLKAVEQVIPHN